MTIAAASGTTALWFITRATGVTALVLLTVTVALGVANLRRLRGRRVPRFVIDAVHRNGALLAVVFLAAHVLTTVLDGYVPIGWLDVVVPFGGVYKPFWLGLGAVGCDLMIALIITSLLRRHVGYRLWRAIHWLAYAAWPVALAHSLGIGTDTATTWMIGIGVACTATVAIAVASRILGSWPAPPSVSRAPARRPALPGAAR